MNKMPELFTSFCRMHVNVLLPYCLELFGSHAGHSCPVYVSTPEVNRANQPCLLPTGEASKCTAIIPGEGLSAQTVIFSHASEALTHVAL